MHTGRNAVRENHSVVLRVNVVLIIGVSHLMYRGQNRIHRFVLDILRRGTAIIFTSPGSKGMFRLILIAPGRIKMKVSKKLLHELLLLVYRKLLMQKITRYLLLLLHLPNKRNQTFLQGTEEGVVLFFRHSRLKIIQHLIIDAFFTFPIAV